VQKVEKYKLDRTTHLQRFADLYIVQSVGRATADRLFDVNPSFHVDHSSDIA
jgi:hypothetical protein